MDGGRTWLAPLPRMCQPHPGSIPGPRAKGLKPLSPAFTASAGYNGKPYGGREQTGNLMRAQVCQGR